jgi:hypothetical protein
MKRCAFAFVFITAVVVGGAQTVDSYGLLPGAAHLLPVGQSMRLAIQWWGLEGQPHEGAKLLLSGKMPEWMVNGKSLNSQDPAEGNLSADLSFERAIYTAPTRVPPVNPVAVSVRFPVSETNPAVVTLLCNVTIVDPGDKWYVSFTYSDSDFRSDVSSLEEHRIVSYKTGSAAMLIKGNPPGADGHVSINTESDTIVSYSSWGHLSERLIDITKDLTGAVEEKTIRNHTGEVGKDRSGFEFEYDPSPGGVKGLAGAGLSFNKTGLDQFWKRNDLNRLVETKETVNELNGANILLGNSADVLKKTPDGFVIDFTDKKDESSTDSSGMRHEVHGAVTYHVTISRKGVGRG